MELYIVKDKQMNETFIKPIPQYLEVFQTPCQILFDVSVCSW